MYDTNSCLPTTAAQVLGDNFRGPQGILLKRKPPFYLLHLIPWQRIVNDIVKGSAGYVTVCRASDRPQAPPEEVSSETDNDSLCPQPLCANPDAGEDQ
ncbi:hypothetical protein R1flu_000566 [Riccia fluitans]|uniref:Uncharacterized protein n=1 Tax=Riccia fluitans TaxID=41844 RepID=A0ABD1Y0T3_9MARC